MKRSRLRSLPGISIAQRRWRAREDARFRPRLRVDSAAPELLLSPHWDDAVLDCWGLLTSRRELDVVNVFAGIPVRARAGVWEATTGARDCGERARRRLEEDTRALALAGRTPVNVDLLDAQYRRQEAGGVALDELDRAISTAAPRAARVHVPAGIGAHLDHLLVRRYGRMLARAGMPVTLYAELPYCTFHGWPSWVDGAEPDRTRNVDAYWESFLAEVAEMPPLRSGAVCHLDADAAAAKLAAIDCYRTSLNYAARQLLADPAFHAYEVSWELVSESEPRLSDLSPRPRSPTA